MKKKYLTAFIFFGVLFIVLFSFKNSGEQNYFSNYTKQLAVFKNRQAQLLNNIKKSNLNSDLEIEKIRTQINFTRNSLKGIDFWLRYLEPVSYKKINGPLPVEWETEVFEKFEKPYKRIGAGFTLAMLYLDEEKPGKDSLFALINDAVKACSVYSEDSITTALKTHDHFYLCNRLFLLNLAAIYTTGFECPDTARIIPELRLMLSDVSSIYTSFNESFPEAPLNDEYISLYKKVIMFVNTQSSNHNQFDHFSFIKNYINPLFSMNQKMIRQYNVHSKSNMDYTLNKNSSGIFSKALYNGQNTKGIFLRVTDEKTLSEIEKIGKLLFYDPILSGNNLRSCASCHKPTEFFTDTLVQTSLQFDNKNFLPRNTPSLINAQYNHLIMADGKHISLQDQTKEVITNSIELSCKEKDVLDKVLSCKEYKDAFKSFLKLTPQENEINMSHISSAITLYYGKFSKYYSPFDKAMNESHAPDPSVQKGFNVFMSKAQCATCHFVPQFNGVKPPYVSSEFEVLGVPADTLFKLLSADKGRHKINPATETENAFRTSSLRNTDKTKPYMHNGVFNDLNQVIDFYDRGGGTGHGLKLNNQTLSSDSLHLSKEEKKVLLVFIKSLNETIEFENPPLKLPESGKKILNKRKVGGEY